MSWWSQDGDETYKANVDGSLSMFAGKVAGEGSLNEFVLNSIAARRARIPRRVKRVDGFHASEVGKMCRRLEVIKRVIPKEQDGPSFEPKTLLRFAIGTAVHDHWQHEILGKSRALRGSWQCSKCLFVLKNAFMPSEPCTNCGWQVNQITGKKALPSRVSVNCLSSCTWPGGFGASNRDCAECFRGGEWLFKETFVRIPDLDVVGSCDGVLLLNHVEQVLEMKTKDTFVWNKLVAPEDAHILQGHVYMKGLGLTNCRIVYVDKNSGLMKEFLIKFEQEIWQSIEDNIKSVMAELAAGTVPNGVCGSPREDRAKECAFVKECFTGAMTVEKLCAAMAERKDA